MTKETKNIQNRNKLNKYTIIKKWRIKKKIITIFLIKKLKK